MTLHEITASKLPRLDLCPGSLLAERGLKDRVSPESEAGQRIHKEIASYWLGEWEDTPMALGLSKDEAEIVSGYITEATQLIEMHSVTRGDLKRPGPRVHVEERLECIDGYSGRPDLVVLDLLPGVRTALVLDWKTGWLEQEPSTTNLQLRAYAALVALSHVVSTVHVALLQRNSPTQVTTYEIEDLIKAREEIREIIRMARAPGAQRHAGERQCRYCKAIGICPEARAMIPEALAAVDPRVKTLPLDVAPEAVELLVHCLDGEQLAFIRERKKVAEMVFACTDEEIRNRLQLDPHAVPGWALKPGNRVRRITNTREAFTLLNGLLDPAQFSACCTVSIGALEEELRSAHGLTVARSKQAVAERLESVIEEKQNQPSIVRAK